MKRQNFPGESRNKIACDRSLPLGVDSWQHAGEGGGRSQVQEAGLSLPPRFKGRLRINDEASD